MRGPAAVEEPDELPADVAEAIEALHLLEQRVHDVAGPCNEHEP